VVASDLTEDEESGSAGMFDLESKFLRTFLLVVAVVLIFAGPTYVPSALNIAGVSFVASTVLGFTLLIIGLVLLWYLIRKKVIV